MDYLGKGEMLANRDVIKFLHNIVQKYAFVHLEHFWDLLRNLMKHGTNILHVAFIFLFSIQSIHY
jgi:hypothetical protein